MFTGFVFSQNNFGSVHSNYTPTNSVYLNPSSMLDAKVWLDINIVGFGSYTNNDFVYLHDQKWVSISRDAINDEIQLEEEDLGYIHGKKKYHAYNRNFVAGLGAVWSQGDHAAGLATTVRSFTDLRRFPDYGGYFVEHGVPEYTPQHDINYDLEGFRIASTHFGEIKGSYAYTFKKRRTDMFMGALSISKFFPIGGAGLNMYNFDFVVDNDSLMIFNELEADGMITPDPQFNWKGGWGLDLGFTYQKMVGEAASYYPNSSKYGCRNNAYKYKLGVSIIDIGYVKIPSDQIQFAGYDFDNFYWHDYKDTEIDEDFPLNEFEAQEDDITTGRVKKPHKMSLPTFVSIQYDYNAWTSRLYLNLTWVQGIPAGRNKFGVRHANSLSFTPRYESFFFDFSLPISLYEYRYPQLGAAIRLGPITIGSDKIISWIKSSDLYGADIYFHLKLPFRYNPKCKGKYKSGNSRKKGQKHRRHGPCEAYG